MGCQEKEINDKDEENLNLRNLEMYSEKAENSLCEIILENGSGFGFFCKIKYPDESNIMYCLITNNHIITKEMLLNIDNIDIKINDKNKNILLNLDRKIWTDETIDFTCIEIIEEDNIIEMINPFEIDDNCYNIDYDINGYDKKSIVLPLIGETKEIGLSQGITYNLEDEDALFFHDCNTKDGLWVGPIVLLNNLKIIGIHKEYLDSYNKSL